MMPAWALVFLLAAWPIASPSATEGVVASGPIRRTGSFYLMGTRISIQVEASASIANRLIDGAFAELVRVDELMSTYKNDSEISRLNRQPAGVPLILSHDTALVLQEALGVAEISGGAYDPTVGPLVRLWELGVGAFSVPSTETLEAVFLNVGYGYLDFDPTSRTASFSKVGLEVDLGAIGKGFAVDRAIAALIEGGAISGSVDLGQSSLGIFGEHQTFAIRHPLRRDHVVAYFELENGSVSTSAGYERGFEIKGKWYSHIIDPRTGVPVQASLSSTVIGRTGQAMIADALSTAGFVLGPTKAVELWKRQGVEGILFFWNDGEIDFVLTPGFPLVKSLIQ